MIRSGRARKTNERDRRARPWPPRHRCGGVPELLRPHLFRRGHRCPPIEISPTVGRSGRRILERWIQALPAEAAARLPKLNLCLFDHRELPPIAQGISFIPQRYVILNDSLLRRPGELGRILYHELCHFMWPRLGNRRRALFEAVLSGELRNGVRGELGNSAEVAKRWVRSGGGRRARRYKAAGASQTPAAARLVAGRTNPAHLNPGWRHYLCESFCDTGAWVMLQLAGRRREHSEWTLKQGARTVRFDAWLKAVSRTEPRP